jgi:hypothetical protein
MKKLSIILLSILFILASCAAAKAPTSTKGEVIWYPKNYFDGEQFIHVVKLYAPGENESPYVYFVEQSRVRQYWESREMLTDYTYVITMHYEVWLNLDPAKAAKAPSKNPDKSYLRFYSDDGGLDLVITGPGMRPSAILIQSWGADKHYIQVAKLYDTREKLSPAAPPVPTQETTVGGNSGEGGVSLLPGTYDTAERWVALLKDGYLSGK